MERPSSYMDGAFVFFGRPLVHFGRGVVFLGRPLVFFGRGSVFFGRPPVSLGRGVVFFGSPLVFFGRGVVHIVRGVSPYEPGVPQKRWTSPPSDLAAAVTVETLQPVGKTSAGRRRRGVSSKGGFYQPSAPSRICTPLLSALRRRALPDG